MDDLSLDPVTSCDLLLTHYEAPESCGSSINDEVVTTPLVRNPSEMTDLSVQELTLNEDVPPNFENINSTMQQKKIENDCN
ncbi:hypothetical protein TNCV_5122691 [Trichonephila clavipes]|nr:hypothetical protein TNCV_5122691 [Trichonephila clavipes]